MGWPDCTVPLILQAPRVLSTLTWGEPVTQCNVSLQEDLCFTLFSTCEMSERNLSSPSLALSVHLKVIRIIEMYRIDPNKGRT